MRIQPVCIQSDWILKFGQPRFLGVQEKKNVLTPMTHDSSMGWYGVFTYMTIVDFYGTCREKYLKKTWILWEMILILGFAY